LEDRLGEVKNMEVKNLVDCRGGSVVAYNWFFRDHGQASMKYDELLHFLQNAGKDPSRLIFEDELTGIFNRRFLHNYFQYKIPWDALKDHPLSLIMMDVDHFKQINDTHGHDAGDQALVRVAGFLKEAAGEEGLAHSLCRG
jgi:GGDEF domain-containing protein